MRRIATALACFFAAPLVALSAHAEEAASPAAVAQPAAAAATKPVAAAAAAATVSTWTLDAKHAEVGFTVDHMMVSKVRGAFSDTSATLLWDEKNPLKSSVDATLEVKSIDTRVEQRNAHLRSPDFFDADKFPKITFKSGKVFKKGKAFYVTGELTIRDVHRPLTLQLTGPAKPVKDPMSGLIRTAVTARGKLSRKDFGLTWNKALDHGGLLVGDEINIDISAEFVKKVD